MLRKILTTPNKLLREKSERVLVGDICQKDMQKLFADMTETMFKKEIGRAHV